MIMLDTVDFPIVFLGAIRAGIVPVPLNTLLTVGSICLCAGGLPRARAVRLGSAAAGREGHRRADARSRTCRRLRQGRASATSCCPTNWRRRATPLRPRRPMPDEPAFWLYSSGSTGMPKGVRHLHSNLAATADTYARQVLGIREDDVCLSAAKLFFAYGLGNALTFPMSVGATTVLNSERPTPALMFALLNKYNPTHLLRRADAVRGDAQRRDAEERARRQRACASAPPPARRCRNRSATPGRRASASTFSTASARPSCCTSSCRTRPATSNTAPRAVRCRATRCGWSTRPAPTSPTARSANCWCDAPSAGEGYWNQRGKSRSTFEGHWTRTGDKYVRDAEGRYTFCGRADDMFKVSGIWVSPFEVESALITHPAVLEAAVVPEADPEGLLKPKAFVVLRAGSQDRRPARGAEGARQAEDRPVEISALDRRGGRLPKTATGKIQRFKLRERQLTSSWPGLDPARSTALLARLKDVDARTSAGHDEKRVTA